MQKWKRDEWIDQFVHRRLNPLLGHDGRDRDAATLAKLRRCAGKQPMSALEQVGGLFSNVPDEHCPSACFGNTLDPAALVASLFALWHQGGERSAAQYASGSFGGSFRRLYTKQPDSESVPRRFAALLDSHPDDLSGRLRHAVSLLKSEDIAIDWAQLLCDLLWWNTEKRHVQRRWAYDFWVGRNSSEVSPQNEDAETIAVASTFNPVSEETDNDF